MNIQLEVNGMKLKFETIELVIDHKDQANIFERNKKTLRHHLDNTINNPKKRLHRDAEILMRTHSEYLEWPIGKFLGELKKNGNQDYKKYLNPYGDENFCSFKLENEKYNSEQGIYCYIVKDEIVYIGRSKKTFKERIDGYGQITPYPTLIWGQSTNCNINSRINNITGKVLLGFYLMSNSTEKDIEKLEKEIIACLKSSNNLWNKQLN